MQCGEGFHEEVPGEKRRSSHEDLAKAIEEAVGLSEDTAGGDEKPDSSIRTVSTEIPAGEAGTMATLKLRSGDEPSSNHATVRCYDGLPEMPLLLARLQNTEASTAPLLWLTMMRQVTPKLC